MATQSSSFRLALTCLYPGCWAEAGLVLTPSQSPNVHGLDYPDDWTLWRAGFPSHAPKGLCPQHHRFVVPGAPPVEVTACADRDGRIHYMLSVGGSPVAQIRFPVNTERLQIVWEAPTGGAAFAERVAKFLGFLV